MALAMDRKSRNGVHAAMPPGGSGGGSKWQVWQDFGIPKSRLSSLKSGGREGIRTPGLLVANEALSQLSYSPTSSNQILANAADLANKASFACKQLGAPHRCGAPQTAHSKLRETLRMVCRTTGPLCRNPLRGLIQRPRLGNRIYGLLHLRIRFEQHFESFLLAEAGHEDFLLDLPLNPIARFRHLRFRVPDGVLAQVFAERAHHVVVHFKILRDRGFHTKVIPRESADARLGWVEHVAAIQQLFEFRQRCRRNADV